ncbi:MAG: HK97 family phage prohead protease [Oligoflexia bacterium]|nr:HK97 family phage prohead protease [Oligoflexia bacterium]
MAFEIGLDKFAKRPVLRDTHCENDSCIIGQVLSLEIRDEGLWAEAWVDNLEIVKLIESGTIGAFSIGYYGNKVTKGASGKQYVEALELFEISVCEHPANPNTKFQIIGRDRPELSGRCRVTWSTARQERRLPELVAQLARRWERMQDPARKVPA